MKAQMGSRGLALLSLTLVLDVGGWVVNATLPLLYPQERDALPIAQEAEWAPGSVRMDAESFAPHRDSIPGPSTP